MSEPDSASRRVPADPPAVSTSAIEDTLDRRVIAEFRLAGTPGSDDFVVMLIDGFIGEAAELVALAKAAFVRLDAPGLKNAAHRLRGSAATMGARRLGALCAQLEAHAGGVLDHTIASALLAGIDDEHARLLDLLELERHGAGQQ